ncbi:MAG: hypothetical protein Q9166_007143 [cf. Caloplaca sp. 2 TL-2023]
MPPHNPVFGHIFVLADVMSKLPKDAHPHYLPDQLRRRYPALGPIFYLDAWPFITLTLVVASPETMAQISTEHVLPKFPAIKDYLFPLANGKDIVSMDGPEWKYWRNMFNPGFSASHLMTLLPDIVRETSVFCDLLQDHAEKKGIFRMKDLTDNLAMDVIGKVVLDSKLGCQRKNNPMVNALRRQMRWMTFGSEGNPFQQLHPLRPFVHRYNTYQMDRYISPGVDARLEMHRKPLGSGGSSSSPIGSKSVIDLALAAYLKQNPKVSQLGGIDPIFKEMAINQMKLFLFSGHDTTSSTVCYVIYLLAVYPEVLSRLRAEHDDVLGQDASQATHQISEDPYLINKLPYTTAADFENPLVIKESMRLFPAASTTRRGEPSFTIIDPRNSLQYPAGPGTLIWMISHACQHDPAFWPRADEFLPERWLTKEGDELFPKHGAWRPFEHGPRACIGKNLSMIELKIVLCLIARRFEISPAYEEFDAGINPKGVVKTVDGERAYQVGKGEPSGFLPCRVTEHKL